MTFAGDASLIASPRDAYQHSHAIGVPDDVDRATPTATHSRTSMAILARRPSRRFSVRIQTLPTTSASVLAVDRRGVLDRARFLPGSEPAGAVSPRDRASAFVRLPTRIRCHLEAGLVQHRRRGAMPSMRLRRLHQPHPPAAGNQPQQPQRIRASATQHRQPTRRRPRTRRSHSHHRRRDPDRNRTEHRCRQYRRAHHCGRSGRTSARTLVATLPFDTRRRYVSL